VATDFRAGAVFEKFGIDFCCGGRRSVADACRQAAVDPSIVKQALQALPPAGGESEDVAQWPMDRLVDYIVATHHAYVRSALPVIAGYLAKLVEVHGSRHPELARISTAFGTISSELALHMLKEERVLFPHLRELASVPFGHACPSPFGSVENPIRMMEREHQEAGDELRFIRELSNGYTPPDDACTTYRVCFAELVRFERDLHRHVHLENNVLFPKAVELERALEAARS
jgi:regulator of cell morphogenesis and NO signaling